MIMIRHAWRRHGFLHALLSAMLRYDRYPGAAMEDVWVVVYTNTVILQKWFFVRDNELGVKSHLSSSYTVISPIFV